MYRRVEQSAVGVSPAEAEDGPGFDDSSGVALGYLLCGRDAMALVQMKSLGRGCPGRFIGDRDIV